MSDIRGIIIEGCDCSGKSTLVKTLKTELSEFGWDVADLGHRDGNQFDRYMKTYVNADRVLFDRGHFSEIVYGDVWRQGKHFSTWERTFLDQFAFEKFIVIFTQVPPETLTARYQERSFKQIISLDELSKIQAAFAHVLANPKTLIYDASRMENLDILVNNVLARLKSAGMKKNNVKPS
jgi:thymidylate kinase